MAGRQRATQAPLQLRGLALGLEGPRPGLKAATTTWGAHSFCSPGTSLAFTPRPPESWNLNLCLNENPKTRVGSREQHVNAENTGVLLRRVLGGSAAARTLRSFPRSVLVGNTVRVFDLWLMQWKVLWILKSTQDWETIIC